MKKNFELVYGAGIKHKVVEHIELLDTTGEEERALEETLPVLVLRALSHSESQDAVVSTKQEPDHSTEQHSNIPIWEGMLSCSKEVMQVREALRAPTMEAFFAAKRRKSTVTASGAGGHTGFRVRHVPERLPRVPLRLGQCAAETRPVELPRVKTTAVTRICHWEPPMFSSHVLYHCARQLQALYITSDVLDFAGRLRSCIRTRYILQAPQAPRALPDKWSTEICRYRYPLVMVQDEERNSVRRRGQEPPL